MRWNRIRERFRRLDRGRSARRSLSSTVDLWWRDDRIQNVHVHARPLPPLERGALRDIIINIVVSQCISSLACNIERCCVRTYRQCLFVPCSVHFVVGRHVRLSPYRWPVGTLQFFESTEYTVNCEYGAGGASLLMKTKIKMVDGMESDSSQRHQEYRKNAQWRRIG